MNWNLVGTILSSSIVAAFLTKALDLYSAKVNYKRDYFKKVIDERLKVYLQLSTVLNQAVGQVVYHKSKYNQVFHDAESFYKFAFDMTEIGGARIWLTNNTAVLVVKIIELVAFKSTDAKIHVKSTDTEIQAFGLENTVELNELIDLLEASMLQDMKKLHEVDDFLNAQGTSKDLEKNK